ncbi:MAG: hypothetical protein U5L72_11080 [Bacteroidales bacterium]|nr:hypothetical protein [Bacteroidales bacterium]
MAVKGTGIPELLSKIIEVFEGKNPVSRPVRVRYGKTVEDAIQSLEREIMRGNILPVAISARYLAIKLLENDKTAADILRGFENSSAIIDLAGHEKSRIGKEFGEEPETAIADARYGFIAGALGETLTYRDGKRGR